MYINSYTVEHIILESIFSKGSLVVMNNNPDSRLYQTSEM